ncbi:Cof-type HAD-IIB family hydrolase [Flavobacterium sediminis]|uniref:Cof-type HAD-IIB family hydrolase n=1 Tax=Flavobacterium sediminis TaxID=2201181 RepID=A0A2U8QSD6_9FLAO|nr:HAD family hydrolase [Flavobacterium sediminis]AWM12786.1 Cof-type HAD-IIB family hydrolase [Flavobacterium sediminis]
MELSKIKLIVSDMDGTLLNSKHELDPSFFEIYEKLRTKNIQFIAASGRQYFSIADKFKPILNELTIIAENGSFVKKNGTEILVKAINISLLQNVIEHARKTPDTYIVLCGKNGAYIEQDSEQFVNYFKEFYNKYSLVHDLLSDPNDHYFKIALYNPNGAEKHIYPYFEDFKEVLQVKISGEYWVDIMQLQVNKGNAIEFIQKQNHITKDETLVFGDYLNDLEMFEQAGTAVAMQNAHPELKKIASYITDSNDHNGVFTVLKKLVDLE